jgi:hypothetical protein
MLTLALLDPELDECVLLWPHALTTGTVVVSTGLAVQR